MHRRDFVKNCLGLGFTYSLAQQELIQSIKRPVPLLLELVSKDLKRVEDDIRINSLSDILYHSLNHYADINWEGLFKKNDRVGIKVSCLPGKKLSSSVNLVKAIVVCLKKAGLKSHNIIVWERTAGELNKAGFFQRLFDCRVIGTDDLAGDGY